MIDQGPKLSPRLPYGVRKGGRGGDAGECTPAPQKTLPVAVARPEGWQDCPTIDAGDEDNCHPDSITPRYLRHRRRLVRQIIQRKAVLYAQWFRSTLPGITAEEWAREWEAAREGRATNQGWERPQGVIRPVPGNASAKGRPLLRVIYREAANPAPCDAYEQSGTIIIVNPNLPERMEQIEKGGREQAERLASYAWPEPPFKAGR